MQILHKLELLVRQSCDQVFGQIADLTTRIKDDGSLVTATDLALQERLISELQAQWQYPVLGEEMSAAQQQALLADSTSGLWIVDPLDGTTNFASGVPYYAISIGLWQNGEITHALVYDPNRDECFTAAKGQGSWCNGVPISRHPAMPAADQAIANIDFKRLPATLATKIVTEHPFRSIRSQGSVALDLCWLANNRFQVYLHGGSRLWDYGAGMLIATEAGSRIEQFYAHPFDRHDASLTPFPIAGSNGGLDIGFLWH